MELKLAIAKIDKYGEKSSGETVEVVERINGGLSIVLGDGLIDGVNKKAISNYISHRVIEQISNGVNDGAAIRLASNQIFTEYKGRVQGNLNVISADLQSNRIIISSNSPVPFFLYDDEIIDCLSTDSEPLGGRENLSPSIVELQIRPDMAIVVFSDGVFNSWKNQLNDVNICTVIESLIREQNLSARQIAESLINHAIRLDNGRPSDSMSVIVIMIFPLSTDKIRRMNASISLDGD